MIQFIDDSIVMSWSCTIFTLQFWDLKHPQWFGGKRMIYNTFYFVYNSYYKYYFEPLPFLHYVLQNEMVVGKERWRKVAFLKNSFLDDCID